MAMFVTCHHATHLLMQCIPFPYFSNMVQDRAFQPAKYKLKDTSETAAILLVYITDTELMCIEYVHIGLIVCCEGSQIYEANSIPDYIQYIKHNLKYTRGRQETGSSTLRAHSYCMFVMNFGGMMAPSTDPPYCLVYPNSYTSTIPE